MSDVNVKEARPTPGEWDVEPVGGGTHWFDLWADGNLIAENIDGPANASLIKASKDMHEVLTDVMTLIEDGLLIAKYPGDFNLSAIAMRIAAAIAKAEAR